MPPPHPEGYDEHSDEWGRWFFSLSPFEQEDYAEAYPEPEGWVGIYRFVSNRPWPGESGKELG